VDNTTCSEATSPKRSASEGGGRGGILVAGSARLVQALIEHDLVDELRLMVYPVSWEAQAPLRRDERHEELRLTDSKSSATASHPRLRPAHNPAYAITYHATAGLRRRSISS